MMKIFSLWIDFLLISLNQIKCEGNCWKFSMYLLIECVGQTRKYLALYHDAQTSPHQVLIS